MQYVCLFDAVAVGVRPEAVRALRAARLQELMSDEQELTGGSEWPQEHVDALIDGIIDGSVPVPDAHARVPSLQAPVAQG